MCPLNVLDIWYEQERPLASHPNLSFKVVTVGLFGHCIHCGRRPSSIMSCPQVTLEPGQVLYVPPQWWHYVECVTPAISVNTWIEMVYTFTVLCKHQAIVFVLCMLPSHIPRLLNHLQATWVGDRWCVYKIIRMW